jgi:flagellar protein FlaJ
MSTQPPHDNIEDELEATLHKQREVNNRTDEIYNRIATLFYPLYERIFSKRTQFTSKLSQKLEKSGRSEPVEVYLSAYLGLGVMSGFIIGTLFTVFFFGAYKNLLVPSFPPTTGAAYYLSFITANIGRIASVIVSWLAITGLTMVSMVGVMIYAAVKSPESKIEDRQKEIDVLLPDAIAFMYCLSTSNMSRVNIMRELATSESIYSEVSVEFQRVVHRIDTFNDDYHTAISDVAEITPSNGLSTFLNDMLSTVSSGGDMESFLETQLDIAMSNVERSQQQELDNLELFNEGYMTASLLPVIGLIVFAFAGSMGLVPASYLMFVAYFGVSIIQLGGLLVITSIFQNDYGSGKLEQDEEDRFEFIDDEAGNILSAGIAKKYQGESRLFDQIYANEIRTRIFEFLRDPFIYVRRRPEYTFIITVPTVILFSILAFATGNIELSIGYVQNNGFSATFIGFYAPLMIAMVPYVYFYEVDLYKRGTITDGLTEDLNKLANTNEKGITLQESLLITAQDRDTKLANEFKEMYKKQQLKIPLGKTIIETNNKYRIPRLARIFRIIKSAQDVSDSITEVLNTASNLAEIQHNVIEDRKSRTKKQVGVVALIFGVFIIALVLMNGVIIDNARDISQTSQFGSTGGSQGLGAIGVGSGGPVSESIVNVVTFHGALIQAILAGMISGYIRTGQYKPGIKYSLTYSTITMVVWYLTPFIQEVL